jgi:ABC-type branched-subunit amino acid transport system substrate-binding protein
MLRRLSILLVAAALLGCPKPTGPTGGPGPTKPRDVKAVPAADEALQKAILVADTRSRKEAIEALFAVRKTYPDSTAGQDALYRAGVLAFEEGDFVTARKAFNELVFENPLHPQADQARLKSGLASVELKAWREAYQVLSPLLDKLQGADRKTAEDALQKAAAGTQQYGEALKLAMKAVEAAQTPDERAAALARLEDVVETKTNFLSITEVWHELPTTHPAWPLLSFKMARVYYHLRDWTNLDTTLKSLLQNAPGSPYTPEAKELLARVSRRADTKPKVVGVVLPLSSKKYKAIAETVQRGLQLGFKGSDVELVVKDTGDDPALAAKLVEQLVFDDGAIAIIGPLFTDDSRRAALVAEELQIPLITLSRAEGLTDIGPHVFRTMVTNAQQAEALVEYSMATLGYKTFAVLYPNTTFGTEFTNAFWDAVEARGGTIRGAETYSHDATTFTDEAKKVVGRYYLEDRADYLEKLREIRDNETDAFRKRKALEKAKAGLEPVIDFEALLLPDSWQKVSLVAPALAVEEMVTNACDKRDLERIQKTTGKDRLKTVTLLGPSTWSSPKGPSGDPQLIERGGKYVLCSVFVDGFYENSDRPSTKAFVTTFREAFQGQSITLLDAVAFDTAGVVRKVIDTAAPKSRGAFREALQQLKGYEGATGAITFTDKREAKRQLFILNITTKGVREVAVVKKPEG